MADKASNNVKYENLRGLAVYCFIHRPDPGNEAEKIGPAYKVDVELPNKDELKKAKSLGLTIKDPDAKHKHPFVTVKSKVMEGRNPPLAVDTKRNPIPNTILIGNGSEIIVRFLPYGYGKGKVSAILKEIQVVNLVRYVPSQEELDRKGFLPPLEEGFVVGDEQSEPAA